MATIKPSMRCMLQLLFFYMKVIQPFVWNLGGQGKLECLFNMNGTSNDLCQKSEKFTVLPNGTQAWITSRKNFYNYTGYDDKKDFHYALYKASVSPVSGDQAALVTPLLNTSGAPVCVSFVYYMSGADLGSLYVVEKYDKTELNRLTPINQDDPESSNTKREKLIAKGDRGEKWIEKKYQTAPNGQSYVQLFFTAVRGEGNRSDIAVDSIKVDSNVTNCPIDGSWGSWISGACSVHCGAGTRTINRTCDNPLSSKNGENCWGKDFSIGSLERVRMRCTGVTNCQQVTVTCLTNCTISNGVISPVITSNTISQNLTLQFAVNETFASLVLTYDDQQILNANPSGVTAQDNVLFDFGNKTVTQIGQKYLFSFTTYLNLTTDDKKSFRYVLNYGSGQQHIGGLLLNLPRVSFVTRIEWANSTIPPVHGGFSSWSEWGSCSRPCGTDGVQNRYRTCNEPSPSHGGRACDGPTNDTTSCNIIRCPNPYGGLQRELFKPFPGNNLSAVYNIAGYPDNPFNVTHLTTFEMINSATGNEDILARYWTYYVAEVTGVHRFHLTCSSLCSIYVDLESCANARNVLKEITEDVNLNQYESENATAEYTLSRRYRYCIQVLHKINATSVNNWLRVGITQPDNNQYYPLDVNRNKISAAPDDKFYFESPEVANISSRDVVISTSCPSLFYWRYVATVVWVRPVGKWYSPQKGFEYENNTNVNVSGLNPWTYQDMHITCVGEEYSLFLTGFPTFKTLEARPSKPPADFNVTFVSSKNIEVSVTWSEVPEDGRHGNITGYRFEVYGMKYDGSSLGKKLEKISGDFAPNKLGTQIDYKCCYYEWFAHRVAGITNAGVGVFTEYQKIMTTDDIPTAAPSGIGLESSNSTTLRAYWKPIERHNRKGIIIAYNISIRLDGFNASDGWTSRIINGSLSEYTFYNLKKWANYEVSIAGRTRKGQGKSESKKKRTNEDKPDSPPTGVIVTSASNDTLNVTWNKIEYFAYGNINGYVVLYRELYHIQWNFKRGPTTEINGSISTQLLGLKAYTRYEVKVAAISRGGVGVFSNVSVVRTKDSAPKQPPENFACNYTSSSSILCSWAKPSVEYASGVVTGYQITYHIINCSKAELLQCNETIHWTISISHNETTNYTFLNLEYFTEYDFRIKLSNRIGSTGYTKPFVMNTDEEVPSAPPKDFVAYPYTTSSILLKWGTLPYGTRRGTLMGYKCYYRKLNDYNITEDMRHTSRQRRDVTGYYVAQDGQKRTLYDDRYMYPEMEIASGTINPAAHEVEIRGLEKYQRYRIRLAALTRAGAGPTANLISRCRPGFPRIAPNLKVVDLYAVDKISLSWNILPWKDANGVLVNYAITYTAIEVGGQDVFMYETVEDYIWLVANSTFLEVRGLQAFTTYAFRIAAVSDRGIGNYSTDPVYGKTCNCPETVTTNYLRYEPYFSVSKSVLESAVASCCQTCNRVNRSANSKIDWIHDRNGGVSRKTSYTKLKMSLNSDTHLTFPIQSNPDRKRYEGNPYVPILLSPGFVVYARPDDYRSSASNAILTAVTNLWAYGIFIVMLILAYGMFIWVIHCNPVQLEREGEDDFPDNYRGAGAGVWWAVNTILRLGEGSVIASGRLGRFFTIPAIVFGIIITCVITSAITVYLLSYVMTTTQAKVMFERVGVLDGTYDRHVVTRMGGFVSQSNTTARSLQKDLEFRKISRVAVDVLYATWHHVDLAKPGRTVSHGLIKRESSVGVVLAGEAKPLAYCFNQHFQHHAQVESKTAHLLRNRKVVAEQELKEKVDALGKYATDKWTMAVIVCLILIAVAFILSSVFELRRRKQDQVKYRIYQYNVCKRMLVQTGNEMLADLQRRCFAKVSEIEVKHAFERIDLKVHMRKNVKFLSPNDVFKYKF